MSFPEDLDMDRILSESLSGIDLAVQGWLKGAPTSEEPLMNRLTEQFARRRRQCDVGVRVPVTMTSTVAFLHRAGTNQSDAYGSDLAITIDIPERQFRKTAIFQLKISEKFSAKVERRQLEQALADPRIADRAFVLVTDKQRKRLRVMETMKVANLIKTANETATIDCAEWMGISEWITSWFSCDSGAHSVVGDPNSVESLLQHFVMEAPDDWESPWGHGDRGNYGLNDVAQPLDRTLRPGAPDIAGKPIHFMQPNLPPTVPIRSVAALVALPVTVLAALAPAAEVAHVEPAVAGSAGLVSEGCGGHGTGVGCRTTPSGSW